MKYALLIVAAIAGTTTPALADPPMYPVGATLRYEVALPGGAWSSSVTIGRGQRAEWRAVLSYTGTTPAAALGHINYQPILSGVDNTGSNVDTLGLWRNLGVSGQGNPSLALGLLSNAEGGSSMSLASYGRVHYGFTSQSTVTGGTGALTGHRHSGGSLGAPAGNYIRIAGSVATNWYPAAGPSANLLKGVVSDNANLGNTWFQSGTTDIVIFRQAFIASNDLSSVSRSVVITSEVASLQRAGGISGASDLRYMTWATDFEGGPNSSIRVGVNFVPATIRISRLVIPAPTTPLVASIFALCALRRRRTR